MRLRLILCICFSPVLALAQPGINEMQQATQDLSGSFFSAFDCSLVLAGIIGIIGAVRIYHNWQMGREHIHIQIAAWFFAAMFMVLAGAFLRGMFGI